MSWDYYNIEKAKRTTITDFGMGGGGIQSAEKSAESFYNTFVNNRNAAYKQHELTPEEIKKVESEYQKVLNATEDFRNFLVTIFGDE